VPPTAHKRRPTPRKGGLPPVEEGGPPGPTHETKATRGLRSRYAPALEGRRYSTCGRANLPLYLRLLRDLLDQQWRDRGDHDRHRLIDEPLRIPMRLVR
jgi:hypothetical protein